MPSWEQDKVRDKSCRWLVCSPCAVGIGARTSERMQPTPLEQLVATNLAELRGQPVERSERSVLLKEGRFVGYRFRSESYEAIWLAESRVIEFYDREMNLLRTVSNATVEQPAAAQDRHAA